MAFIIAHGKTYKKVICDNCNATYTTKDITYYPSMSINWEPIEIDAIKCPECSNYIEVNKLKNMIERGLVPTKEDYEKYKNE